MDPLIDTWAKCIGEEVAGSMGVDVGGVAGVDSMWRGETCTLED